MSIVCVTSLIEDYRGVKIATLWGVYTPQSHGEYRGVNIARLWRSKEASCQPYGGIYRRL